MTVVHVTLVQNTTRSSSDDLLSYRRRARYY